jgi:hypothetical protein
MSQQASSHGDSVANAQRAEQVSELLRILKTIDPQLAAQWAQNPSIYFGDYRPDLVAALQRQVERAQYDAAIAADAKATREAREAERLAAMPPLTDAERQEIEALLPELMRLDPQRAEHWSNYVLRGWNQDTLDFLRKRAKELREVAAYFQQLRAQQQKPDRGEPGHEARVSFDPDAFDDDGDEDREI